MTVLMSECVCVCVRTYVRTYARAQNERLINTLDGMQLPNHVTEVAFWVDFACVDQDHLTPGNFSMEDKHVSNARAPTNTDSQSCACMCARACAFVCACAYACARAFAVA